MSVEPERRFAQLPEVIKRTGLSKATIHRKELRGEFPRRHKISANVVAWYESDLQRWLRSPMPGEEAALSCRAGQPLGQPAAPCLTTR